MHKNQLIQEVVETVLRQCFELGIGIKISPKDCVKKLLQNIVNNNWYIDMQHNTEMYTDISNCDKAVCEDSAV